MKSDMKHKTLAAVLAAALWIAPAPAAASSTDDAPGEARAVTVRLTEYTIDMPVLLSAGRTIFTVINTGSMLHGFEIEGKGIEEEIDPGLDAGETKTLELDLRPGTYRVYCPVSGHRKAGMSIRVRVE